MDELIDIVDKNYNPTGKTALKSEVHKHGYWHNTGHLWLYTKNKEILLSQRSFTKSIYPGLWDVSVAGHIDAGESITQGILRECKEEISLQLNENDLFKVGVFKNFKTYKNGISDNEFHHTFIAELKLPIEKLKPQPNEVEALQLVSFNTFIPLLANSNKNNYFIATNRAYYNFIFNEIKKRNSFT